MINKEKFKNDCEAKVAYKQWCEERVRRGWECNSGCTFCFKSWLNMEEDDYGDFSCFDYGYWDGCELCDNYFWIHIDRQCKENNNG